MLSIPDMALLGAAALIFFGPEQLPKVARKVGLLVRDVQNTSQTFIREMERAADEHDGGEAVSRAHLLDEPPIPSYGAYGDVPLEVPAPDPVAHDALLHETPAETAAGYDAVGHEAIVHEVAAHEPAAPAGHEPPP
jgi:sec-independent protein translocase protein TatA